MKITSIKTVREVICRSWHITPKNALKEKHHNKCPVCGNKEVIKDDMLGNYVDVTI